MSAKKSPFVPLLSLREERAEEAARRLASARSAADLALLAAEQRAQERRRLEAHVAMTEAELQTSTLRGARAGDLAQAADWRRGADARRRTAEGVEAAARKAVDEADAVVQAARAAVTMAEADVDAATTLLQRERSAAVKKETAAMEEAAEEVFVSRAWRARS